MTQPFNIDAMRADMEAGTPGPWELNEGPSLAGQCHCVHHGHTMVAECWDQDDETDARNARRIARVPAMEAEILRLTAENERLQQNHKLGVKIVEGLRAENARLREIARRGADLIDGDLVGQEWKRACRAFVKAARAALGETP